MHFDKPIYLLVKQADHGMFPLEDFDDVDSSFFHVFILLLAMLLVLLEKQSKVQRVWLVLSAEERI